MSDITPVLEGLRDGTVSTEDAAARLAARQWPVRRAHEPAVTPGEDLTADVADGSFGEVAAAYAAGWINDEQYLALAEAYGQAQARAAGSSLSYPDSDGRDADGDWDGDTSRWRTAPDIPAGQENLFPVNTGTKTAGDAEHEVYVRGVMAWPGEEKTVLSPHDWAQGRVGAFRRRASGELIPGYTRDDDLLS